MRQLLLSHLVSKLNSLDIYNIFIDMKTQISKCFVSAHTVMDRVCSNAEFLFLTFFLSWRGDGDNNNYNKMCSYIFYVVVSLRTVVVFVTSFLRSVSCIYVCGKVNVCL